MSGDEIWNPEDDPRYQRVKKLDDLFAALQEPFGTVDNMEEMLLQNSSMHNLLSVLLLQQSEFTRNLLESVIEVVPPTIQAQIVARFRGKNAGTQARQDRIRRANRDMMRGDETEPWQQGLGQEWGNDDPENQF